MTMFEIAVPLIGFALAAGSFAVSLLQSRAFEKKFHAERVKVGSAQSSRTRR